MTTVTIMLPGGPDAAEALGRVLTCALAAGGTATVENTYQAPPSVGELAPPAGEPLPRRRSARNGTGETAAV